MLKIQTFASVGSGVIYDRNWDSQKHMRHFVDFASTVAKEFANANFRKSAPSLSSSSSTSCPIFQFIHLYFLPFNIFCSKNLKERLRDLFPNECLIESGMPKIWNSSRIRCLVSVTQCSTALPYKTDKLFWSYVIFHYQSDHSFSDLTLFGATLSTFGT